MKELHLKAIVAGICFGAWPLFMNKSGLKGNVASALFTTMTLLCVLPFAIYTSRLTFPSANWVMVILAGVVGAVGLLVFNSLLANATPQDVSTLFALATVVQITVIAIYQGVVTRQFAFDKVGGCLAAAVAAYLLLR